MTILFSKSYNTTHTHTYSLYILNRQQYERRSTTTDWLTLPQRSFDESDPTVGVHITSLELSNYSLVYVSSTPNVPYYVFMITFHSRATSGIFKAIAEFRFFYFYSGKLACMYVKNTNMW